MEKNFTYILKCNDGSYFTSYTTDLEKSLQQHQAGKVEGYTQKRLPIELVYFEVYSNKEEAFNRFKQLKGWSRAKKEALMKKDFDALHELAKCKNSTSYKNK